MSAGQRRIWWLLTLPRIMPLVLKRRATAFDNPDYLYELKYDGFRALLEIDDSGARLVSRNRNRFRHLDTLATALAKRLRANDAILEGEIICADESGRPIFLEMLRGRHPCCFIAFDTVPNAGPVLVEAHDGVSDADDVGAHAAPPPHPRQRAYPPPKAASNKIMPTITSEPIIGPVPIACADLQAGRLVPIPGNPIVARVLLKLVRPRLRRSRRRKCKRMAHLLTMIIHLN
jgi:ATP dependent DNA ligase-like protein